jgi:hypothetical protein
MSDAMTVWSDVLEQTVKSYAVGSFPGSHLMLQPMLDF